MQHNLNICMYPPELLKLQEAGNLRVDVNGNHEKGGEKGGVVREDSLGLIGFSRNLSRKSVESEFLG